MGSFLKVLQTTLRSKDLVLIPHHSPHFNLVNYCSSTHTMLFITCPFSVLFFVRNGLPFTSTSKTFFLCYCFSPNVTHISGTCRCYFFCIPRSLCIYVQLTTFVICMSISLWDNEFEDRKYLSWAHRYSINVFWVQVIKASMPPSLKSWCHNHFYSVTFSLR